MDREALLGNLRSYNGKGEWSIEGVRKRYLAYCSEFKVARPRLLVPCEYQQGEVRWVYPIMEEVIKGIAEGDAACVALGVDFVEQDTRFPFGAKLKSNTARALRRAQINEHQKIRLRERIATMLVCGAIPHEMREYYKLFRAIGVAEQWSRLHKQIPRENRYAMRFYEALCASEGQLTRTQST